MNGPILRIRDLRVAFDTPRGMAEAVRGADLDVRTGVVHGLVGESGSGKTVTGLSIMGLLPRSARVTSGDIEYRGRRVLEMDGEDLRLLRGREMAMVFQEPARYLNPSLTVSEQVREMLSTHLGLHRREARERIAELFRRVGLDPTRGVLSAYPHELSGGMRQRAMIAMAVSCSPSLLIADEPTTAVDVTLQVQILQLLLHLQREMGMAVLFISHDLAVIRDVATTVSVMYSGTIVESGAADVVFDSPLHPYTQLLLSSIPSPERRGQPLDAIQGVVPDALHVPPGCPFHPRCPRAIAVCAKDEPHPRDWRGTRVACHRVGEP